MDLVFAIRCQMEKRFGLNVKELKMKEDKKKTKWTHFECGGSLMPVKDQRGFFQCMKCASFLFSMHSQTGENSKLETIKGEWIKTKEELPPDLLSVLLFYKDEYGSELITGHWDEENAEFVQTARGFLHCGEFDELYHKKKRIPCWMLLPEVPDEVD